MKPTKHNKRRNAGLLYEFLMRYISKTLVEDDQNKSSFAFHALKKFFSPGTELFKEFRLLHALMKTEVSSQNVAASILSEAKIAARSHNTELLEREKSSLIKFINHKLDDGTFWDQPISEYRMLATVQTLINDWRTGVNAPFQRVAEYEDQLTKWLTEAKSVPEVHSELAGTPGENRLVFKLMMKKLNEKYSVSLTNDQRSILREYVFAVSTDRDYSSLQKKLQDLKESTLRSLDTFLSSITESSYIYEKLVEAKASIEAEKLDEINDNVITKFMLLMKLVSELETRE